MATPELQFSAQDKARLRSLLRQTWKTNIARSWIRLIDTQSMLPMLSGNLLLLAEWATAPKAQVGDLLLFALAPTGVLVVHRFCGLRVRENQTEFLQLADAPNGYGAIAGGWVPADQVFGRVVAVRQNMPKTPNVWLNTPLIAACGQQIAHLSACLWRAPSAAEYPTTTRLHFCQTAVGRRVARSLHWLLRHLCASLLRLPFLSRKEPAPDA